MIDPAEVGHVSMPVPQYPPSDESEGNDRTFNSELRDLVDSRLRPDLPPDDPTGSFTSTQSGLQASSANGQPSGSERRKRGQKKERHSALAQREMVRLLANEEAEAKSMRKYLRAALDRLDGETRRAQDAERRALEIAERFRVVNEARQSTQSELTRVTEELRLWRNQFESAQKEILRARDVFKELEEQRDSAESDATRYRTLARKLNEERMVNKAREEGRREGYEEGLRRGMEQGRSDAYGTRRRRDDVVVEDDDDDESSVTQQDDQDQRGQRQPDDMRSIMSESIPPLDIPTRVPLNNLSLRGGTQFHENFTPASTATRSLAPMQETPANDQPRMVRPPSSIHNRPPSVHHPENVVPPDNWIPALDASNNRISMPPPHEFVTRTGSPYSDNPPLPPTRTNFVHVPPNEPAMKDIFSKPPSIAESVQSSTAMSQYELLAPANVPAQQQKKEKAIPRLDRIEEVSSSLEYSPGFEKRMTPVPVTFPQASGSGDSDWGDGSHGSRSRKQSQQSLGHGSPRSRTLSQGQGQGQGQRQPDDARYSTSTIDNWRREAATNADPKQYPSSASGPKPVYPQSGLRHEVSSSSSLREPPRQRSVTAPRPRSPAGPRSTTPLSARLDIPAHMRSLQASPASAGSSEYMFELVPPSGTPSLNSPVNTIMNDQMLSPNIGPSPHPLPDDTLVPTEPNTPTMRQPSLAVVGTGPPSIGGFPPGFVPVGPPRSMPAAPPSAPPMQQTRTHPGGMPGGPTWTMPIPDRSTSAQGRSRPVTPAYEAAPMPDGIQYPAPPFGRPRDSPKVGPAVLSPHSRPRDSPNAHPAVLPPYGNPNRPRESPRVPAAALDTLSPHSNASRFSPGHQRSLSLNAGATPGMSTLSLSGNPPPKLRKMPSSESVGSNISGRSRASTSVSRFDPKQYVDIAALASSEDLLASMQSPGTAANTKANAGMRSMGGALRGSMGGSTGRSMGESMSSGGASLGVPGAPVSNPAPSSASAWSRDNSLSTFETPAPAPASSWGKPQTNKKGKRR